jgi:hypothetical protein
MRVNDEEILVVGIPDEGSDVLVMFITGLFST